MLIIERAETANKQKEEKNQNTNKYPHLPIQKKSTVDTLV